MKKVAIIGGGYTGLVTAYRLAKKGIQTTIYERGTELGGLVVGFEIDGVPLERAYHFLYTTDSEILSLSEELGIRENISFYNSSVSLYYNDKLYPFMTPVDLLRFKEISFISRIRNGLAMLYLSYVRNWFPLTQITAYEWLLKYTGEDSMRVIWEPLLKGKFDTYYDKIAMSWLWARIRIRARSKDKGDVTEKLGYFRGGFRLLSDALASEIKRHGGKVVTNAEIKRIDSEGEKPYLIHGEEKKEFDLIISTTPTNVFSKLVKESNLVDEKYLESLRQIDYLGAVILVFSSSQTITPYYWHNVNDEKIPFVVFLSKSALAGSEHFKGKNIYYIGSYVPHNHEDFVCDDEKIKKNWYMGIQKMFPDFDEQKIEESHIFRFKDAQHIVGVDYPSRIPDYETKIPGVYLANFSQIFPNDRGTNYAVDEGNKMADRILKKFKM